MPRRYSDQLDQAVVVALDPGGTTGWSVMTCEPDALSDPDVSVLKSLGHWAHGQIGGDENSQAMQLGELVAAWTGCALVIERFTLRTFKSSPELLSPVRITAKLDLLVSQGLENIDQSTAIWYQDPSLAMNTATDDRLRAWDLYQREGGMEHARDADRHAITFLRRASASKQLRHGSWPHLYDKHGRLI